MKKIFIEDVDNLYFWINYIGCCYPNGYDEEEDASVSELMRELYTEEAGNWWHKFTGYYEGILDENDGYLEDPATLAVVLAPDKTLKIQFHPGDILYYINDVQIGSTGPHWELQRIPYKEIEQLLSLKNGWQLFLLLLPLAFIEKGEAESAREMIAGQMRNYLPEKLCKSVSRGIVAGAAVFDD